MISASSRVLLALGVAEIAAGGNAVNRRKGVIVAPFSAATMLS